MKKRRLLKEIFQGAISLSILTIVILNHFSILTPATVLGIFKIHGQSEENYTITMQNYNVQLPNVNNNNSVNNNTLQNYNIKFTEEAYRYPINYYLLIRYNNSQDKFVLTNEKTIVLRMDDIQGYAWNDIFINLTNAILDKNMSVSLAVIPDRPNRSIEEDIVAKKYLISKVKDPRVEITQHGLTHVTGEFSNLSESQAYDLANTGLQKIVGVLNVHPVTFIPPDNQINENTTAKALSELGFKIISADQGEYKYDNGIIYIGYTIPTKHSNEEDLVPTSEILGSCKKSLDTKNICVIMIHPQDYFDGTLKTLNQTRYDEFTNMLDRLKTLNAKYSTLVGLIE